MIRGAMGDDLEHAYQAYAVELQRFAVARGFTRDEADDVCSEVFVNAARSRYTDCGAIRGWLFRILHSRIVDTQRRDRRRPVALLDADTPAAPEDDPILTRVWVSDLLRMVSPHQRRVLELHYLHDLELQDVARRMGISHDAAKIANHRALVALRARSGEQH